MTKVVKMETGCAIYPVGSYQRVTNVRRHDGNDHNEMCGRSDWTPDWWSNPVQESLDSIPAKVCVSCDNVFNHNVHFDYDDKICETCSDRNTDSKNEQLQFEESRKTGTLNELLNDR